VRYVYLGDRMTADRWRGRECDPVRRADGRCIARRGSALVVFDDGSKIVVNRRRLRLTPEARRAGGAIEYPAGTEPSVLAPVAQSG
jgi:hypothetical protein